MATVMRQFLDNSYLYGANASFIEDLYEKYLVNPQSVPEAWREYFDRIQVLPGNPAKDVAHAPVVESFVQRAKAGQLGGQARTLPAEPVTPERLQVAALLLVTAYRIAGSRWATVDPLKRMPRPGIPELEPGFYDLSEADLDQTVNAGSFVGLDRTSLRNLLQALRDTYCRNIGFEYMFIGERAQRQWIQERIEPVRATPEFPPEQKKRLLQKLTEAEQLERYLHTRYVGQKRFSLAFNPSHLEIVDPVVEGSVRARQRRRDDKTGDQVLPVLLHGDAAFAAQGVVMETLNLSGTRGFGTGGTVHIIINNQIGFTTSDPRDTRSTIYCTDVAKMVEAPIFHVNGDDPEAVLFITQLALDFRQKFHKDVVIDIVCFRKLGHNEQDEPLITQPLMYKKIAQHPGTRKLYADKLLAQGVIAPEEPEALIKQYRAMLDAGQQTVSPVLSNFKSKFAVDWAPFLNSKWTDAADTQVPLAELQRLAERLTAVPEGFKVHPTVLRVIESRKRMAEGKLPVDWGMAETLAYASLLANGYDVRLSGQDTGRGTFAHRHAVLHDQERERWDEGSYIPLQNISKDQGDFVVIDSVLSEEAVLGFEYGFSTAEPNALVIWEAQFGDFANGAQVVMDQFISSGETKWGRVCGLTQFLPHGYEGQGPEHSSARLERYLQLCAEHNMQVCVPTNAAQIFHLLRRQMLRPFRKPLVVMTPKSLLRKKEASASIHELASGSFQTVIPELEPLEAKDVKRIIACCGKIYYDLVAKRKELQKTDVAVVRLEQLYPFPHKQFEAEVKRYPGAGEVVWCQEEPQNQGAWYQSGHYLRENMRDDQKLCYAGRPPSASPASGYMARHNEAQKALVEQAFGKFK